MFSKKCILLQYKLEKISPLRFRYLVDLFCIYNRL